MTPGIRTVFFRRALERATALVAGDRRLGRLLAAATATLQDRGRPLDGVRRDAQALVRMVREAASGRYRRLPKRSLIAIVAALLYFLDPLDAIPDLIPVVGFVDDAAVLAWVASRVHADLQAFLDWEAGQWPVIDVEAVAMPAR